MSQTTELASMVTIHDALRKEFASLPLAVKSTPAGDAAKAAVIADHIDLILLVLISHHTSEDELLWPWVEERAPEQADSIREMRAEHQDLANGAEHLVSLSAAWRSDPTEANRAALHTALIAYERSVLTHLGREEAALLTVAAGVLSPQEFAELQSRQWSSLTDDQQILVLGMLLDTATPEIRAALLSAVGPGTRDRFDRDGHAQYQAYRRRLLD